MRSTIEGVAAAEYATPAATRSPRRASLAALIVLGPILSVALFILGIAFTWGIPPRPASPGQPLWVGLLFYAVPFLVGLLVSARGVAGLTGWRVWRSVGAALVILVVGIGLISVGLWRLGWPVLVTGGY